MTEAAYLVAAFAFLIGAFIYGLLALLVWQKSAKSEKDWVFLFAMAALAVWCLANTLTSSLGAVLEKPHNTFELLLLQIAYPVLYTVPPAIRHTMVLSRLSQSGWRKWAHVALNYLGIVPVVVHLFMSSRPLPEHYGPAFSGLLFFYIPLTLIEIRTRKELRDRYAQNPGARSVIWAGMGGALLLVALPPFFCQSYPEHADIIGLIGKFGALPPALAIAYGALRYRFMDVVLTRSLLYTSLGGLVIGLYVLAIQYGGRWFSPGDSHPVAFAAGILLLLCAFHFLFHVMRDGLQKAIERSVFRHRLRSAEILKGFSQTLTTWSDLGGLCGSFAERVTESLGLSSGAILFADGTVYSAELSPQISLTTKEDISRFYLLLTPKGPRPLVVDELIEGPLRAGCYEKRIGLILPLPCREQRGWLLLGEKRSGRPFLSQEIALLEAVCGQLAVAIDNLLLVQAKIALEREMQHREKLAAIGQLAATVAHEIRNPITGAKCLLQQVEDELSGSAQSKEYVQLALEDLERVERSVNQLLTFARKEEFHFSEVEVMELVKLTAQRFAPEAQRPETLVRVQEHPPLQASIDEEKIRRVLMNLLINAADAVNGNGRVEVAVSASGPEVEIRVSDNGCGLSPEEQAKIFEPFFTTKEKGTGLGLAIAKKIVEGHGGRITAASMPGQGTTFIVTLPRQRSVEKAAA
ncbi:MAG: ATP-binding protein [Candidatus Binatia bacterium]